MPFVDVRNLPQVAQLQSAFDALVNRANLSLSQWNQQVMTKIAEFFATPARIDTLNTRITFTEEKARSRNNMDALGKLSGIKSYVAQIGAAYAQAKPTVQAAVERARASGLGLSISLPTDLLMPAVNAGILMNDVFTALGAQEAAISAVERGVLTPAEAAELYKRLQSPTIGRNTVLVVGGLVVAWLLFRRRSR